MRFKPRTIALAHSSGPLESMTSKTLILLSTLLLGAALPAGPAAAQDANMAREAMARAMVRMMELMGMFGAGVFGSGSGVPLPPAMNPMGTLASGASPWDLSSMQDPSKAMGLGSDMMKQMTQSATGSTIGSGSAMDGQPLDGVWEGGGGDMLIVQGGRYRIYAPQDQHVDGLLQRQASRVALYNAQDGHTRIFEYATQDGRLALRDGTGQVYLYRRFGTGPVSSPLSQNTPAIPATPMAPSTSSTPLSTPSTASTR
jgi:cytochrome c556